MNPTNTVSKTAAPPETPVGITPLTALPALPTPLSQLSLPLRIVCDIVCGAFTRREVVAQIGAATPAHLAVLRALLEHVGATHNRVFPSQKRLAELTGLCHSSVERAVLFFKRAGAILVLPDFLRRSPDAYPVNGYDLSPLLSLISGGSRSLALAGFGESANSDTAFFSFGTPQNCGTEGSVIVVDCIDNNTTNHTPSTPHSCSAEEGAVSIPDPPDRSSEDEEQIVYAASALTGFGVAAHLAYDLAAERGAARTMEVVNQAQHTKTVGAGWLVAALRDGWEFPKRGETSRYGNTNAPFVTGKFAPKVVPSPTETAPIATAMPVSVPDTLDALTPGQYNAAAQEAEAQIRAENPFFGRLGAPRIPRPAVRDRMRKLLALKQTEAQEQAQLDAVITEDDIYYNPFTDYQG